MTPSFSAAWLFRWGGVAHLRGTVGDARTWLLADPVPRSALRGRHRINQYKLLMGQDPDTEARNHPLERFVEAGAALARRGVRIVVLGGPGERDLTRTVAEGVPGALDFNRKNSTEDHSAPAPYPCRSRALRM